MLRIPNRRAFQTDTFFRRRRYLSVANKNIQFSRFIILAKCWDWRPQLRGEWTTSNNAPSPSSNSLVDYRDSENYVPFDHVINRKVSRFVFIKCNKRLLQNSSKIFFALSDDTQYITFFPTHTHSPNSFLELSI